jgi:ABC-type Mn2+/Zn2+ transport system ATPase subunit
MKDLIRSVEEATKIVPPRILENIACEFKSGKIYGIVGKNGA